ncbi:heparinase II/III-like protein [Pseudoduganella flava]|uniref:Heparinase II/III-like protein n=1 Tax=Pseudoduganella flava TaxID=871742 RepID=A0A562PI46_9BURK|nr:heparinase II/III family protein [Pseudoduganella flava]QGZ42811.1 hypothetical protein GO485_29745 [Pseudoduganella flava]TWI44087.1 heparinase II/III-like protein [Pseudoduganella flava]
MHLKPVLRALLATTAGLALYAPCAHAAETSIARPFLYATPADIEALKKKLPTRPDMPKTGAIHLRIKPTLLGATDPAGSVIFGDFNKQGALSIRYLKDADGQTATNIQARLVKADGTEAFNLGWRVPTDGELRLIIRYDAAGTVRIYVNGSATAVDCGKELKCDNTGWKPAAQNYYFVGRKGQQIAEFYVEDSATQTRVWDGTNIDWEVGAAYFDLADHIGPGVAKDASGCKIESMPSGATDVCNVAKAGRVAIADTAQNLAFAYRLTGDPVYWDAAKNYVDVILKMANYNEYDANGKVVNTGFTVGGEWAQSARVAALGILYDWFYDLWSEARRAEIRKAIADNIRADDPKGMMDLIGMNCGPNGKLTQPTEANWTELKCVTDPDIARYYIMGHNASAMAGTAIGLLAIVDDDARVRPLLDQIYGHLVNGLLPARKDISIDGGHHTLFSYGSTVGEVIERLIMWRRARAAHGQASPELEQDWIPRLVFPFIDGLRADGTYPASGDYFATTVDGNNIGYMALAAATSAKFTVPGSTLENARGIATAFYEDQIAGKRSRANAQALWDALYFPGTKAARVTLDPTTRKLASHYSIAGNVFMRNSWDFANAALLDFKSTSFASENHQHLDQNSFSLYYKGPLLLDSGYGNYGTAHWHNYYRRTIAHNTIVVHDPAESYTYRDEGKTVPASNDGGQWFTCEANVDNGGKAYPTREEIKSRNGNVLDGVDEFEDGYTYSYVSANAGKAYLSPSRCHQAPDAKGSIAHRYRLHPQDGFRRQIVYLRAKDKRTGADLPPTILVYDRVNSPYKLPAVSLLHTAKMPRTFQKPTPSDTSASRYTVPGPKNAPLVVRNDDAMVTIEPLLPARAYVTLAGGAPGDGSSCAAPATNTSTDNCRFTVRDANGVWTNYPVEPADAKETPDFGAWRIEIGGVPETTRDDAQYQYFLNVMRVAEHDLRDDAPQDNQAVLLPIVAGGTHAVQLDRETAESPVVVFNGNFPDAEEYQWKPAADCTSTPFIAIGGVPNATYGQSYSNGVCILKRGGTGVQLKSSAKGVIQRLPAL